jgi:hypothetical protein
MPDSVNTRFPVRWVGVLLVALLTPALAGCVHTSTIPLVDLSQSLDKDIVVTTHDGKTTRYNAGCFEVIMSDSGRVLRTKGSVGDGQAGQRMGKHGSALAFANIKVIETREKTAFYYTGPVLVAFMAVLLIVLHGAIKQ